MPRPSLDDLERVLKALSNVNRLRLLVALQTPKSSTEIELSPSRGDKLGSEDRPISRQAVREHLQPLLELGIVRAIDPEEGPGPKYVVDHARLYAVVDQMRTLATVRPVVEVAGVTAELGAKSARAVPTVPHVVLVRGVEEGRAFALDPKGGPEWVIGRKRDAAVPLDYDPYVSTEHARILNKDGRFFLVDSPQNKNGTLLNWNEMVRGGVAPLKSGDVIGVGMSLLVFRA